MKNETYDRYKFFSRNQQVGQSFDDFLTDIKLLAVDCNFGTLEESLLRDKIVHGILDAAVEERMLQQSNLLCKKAEEICRAAEVSHYQVKELDNGNGKQVDVVYTTKTGTKPKGALKDGGLLYDCFKCGRKHVEQAEIPILGLNAYTKLQLLKKVDSVGLSFTNKDEFVAKNKEVFEGTGRYMFIADLLSRSFIKTDTKHSEQTIVVYTLDFELPISDNSLNFLKNATNSDPVLTQLNSKRLKAKKYYDQHSQHRDVFKVGDSVLLQKEKGKQWVPGEIVGKAKTPRSYFVKDEFGKVLRRNSSFLKKRLSNTTVYWRAIDFDFDDTVEPCPSVSPVPEVSINGNSSVPQITRTGRVINKPVRYRN
ncbi:hypothetical protein ILUMI_05058 [Ignelater luminosus]|uniref:Uncharacterized protein n=1 Tax=Ignelater luminosus TaxID=2038154 RepID=A0A8K0DD98_IGNLU|nr:hypothetical protein ILUMI_05058 [Ignelater luminosus]